MSKYTVTLTEHDHGDKVTTYHGDSVSIMAMDDQRLDDDHVAIMTTGALMGFGTPPLLEAILSSLEELGKEKFAALLIAWMAHRQDRKAVRINMKEGVDQA